MRAELRTCCPQTAWNPDPKWPICPSSSCCITSASCGPRGFWVCASSWGSNIANQRDSWVLHSKWRHQSYNQRLLMWHRDTMKERAAQAWGPAASTHLATHPWFFGPSLHRSHCSAVAMTLSVTLNLHTYVHPQPFSHGASLMLAMGLSLTLDSSSSDSHSGENWLPNLSAVQGPTF